MNIPMNICVSKAFDYLSANTHYSVTNEGKKELLFRNNKTGSATVMYKAEVDRAIEKGWLIRE